MSTGFASIEFTYQMFDVEGNPTSIVWVMRLIAGEWFWVNHLKPELDARQRWEDDGGAFFSVE